MLGSQQDVIYWLSNHFYSTLLLFVLNERRRRHKHQQQQQWPAKLRLPVPVLWPCTYRICLEVIFESPRATRSAIPTVTSDPVTTRIFTISSIYNVTNCFFYGLCCDASGPEMCLGGWVEGWRSLRFSIAHWCQGVLKVTTLIFIHELGRRGRRLEPDHSAALRLGGRP